jgi:major vault protein
MAEKDDSRELVLAPNESACILDKTNGQVFLYVGPKQDSLAPSVQPVLFNPQTKVFDRVDLARAIQRVTIAPEGWYAVLKNPAKNGAHPQPGNKAAMPELETGRKIIISGPTSFALWPGQMVKVLPGHRLRSNQYLIVRVYDQTAARENWKNATIEKADTSGGGGPDIDAASLTTGQLVVIRGTDTAFFIPPTGIEVVPYRDDAGEEKLVRDAVSLEKLDYTVLLDESGSKRFVQGPAVVFPEPTEVFITKEEDGKTTRKFRCIELNETSGIYVKVIADYHDDEAGKDHKAGDELFITGKDEKIYFPREEHAIIKYGDEEIHYATAIPAGEGRYVLDRLKGEVRTIKGPAMYLPDPRHEVFVRRVLDQKLCELLYPGNAEALAHNQKLGAFIAAEEAAAGAALTRTSALRGGGMKYGAVAAAAPGSATMDALYLNEASLSNSLEDRGLGQIASKGFTGDGFDRKGRYTEPRTVTLNTKYAGVVTTDIWTGYAIKLVKRDGSQRVEVGPKSVMLDYDEVPQVLKLSTGKPKNADNLYRTAFLMARANKVSDIVEVETGDYCKLQLKLSYRVDFEGDPSHWFGLENYVKFMTDHMRSRLKASCKKLGVEEFYRAAVEHVRDTVLGSKPEGGGQRPGAAFAENGMRVYDVEVLEVKFLDASVEQLLVKAQRESITQALDIGGQRRALDFARESARLQQETEAAKAQGRFALLAIKEEEIGKQLHHDIAAVHAKANVEVEMQKTQLAREGAANEVQKLTLLRERATAEQSIDFDKQRQEARLRELRAEVEAVVEKAKAVSPDLIAAIGSFGERALIEKLAESMSPLAIIGGTSVTDVVKKLLEGTKLAQFIGNAPANGTSGKALPAAEASK